MVGPVRRHLRGYMRPRNARVSLPPCGRPYCGSAGCACWCAQPFAPPPCDRLCRCASRARRRRPGAVRAPAGPASAPSCRRAPPPAAVRASGRRACVRRCHAAACRACRFPSPWPSIPPVGSVSPLPARRLNGTWTVLQRREEIGSLQVAPRVLVAWPPGEESRMAKPRGKRIKEQPKEAATAAAAAIAGVAAAGGKLAWGKLSGRGEEPSRAYRLHEREYVPDGLRRVARGQLECGLEDLDGEPSDNLDQAVHESRKRLKRLRATLRLGRGGIDQDTYKAENAAFRDAGRRLAGPRDAAVLVETLDELTQRFADELRLEDTTPLRERLVRDHERQANALRKDESALESVRGELDRGRARTAAW